jgi:hypothetical protein
MRRSHASAKAASVSLFPFLAVLICTMGALILLLVVIARQARVQAAQTAPPTAKPVDQELKDEQALIRWRISQWRQTRDKTRAELAQQRAELGHVEDHSRRLTDELARLEATAAELARVGTADRRRQDEIADELARLRTQIAEADRRVAEAERQAKNRRPSYSIVPYAGPSGTRRRPLYIECLADAVILQPEGVKLSPEDFEGPMGPGNPLAAAIRAAGEHLARGNSGDSSDPYPLLLVRPDGIVAYYAARAAIESWGPEFGYELIGDDWTLDFPPHDPALAQTERLALEDARQRQRRLVLAAPRAYGGSRPATFRASPTHGGMVPDEEPGEGTGSGFSRYPDFKPRGGRPGSAENGMASNGTTPQKTGSKFPTQPNFPFQSDKKPPVESGGPARTGEIVGEKPAGEARDSSKSGEQPTDKGADKTADDAPGRDSASRAAKSPIHRSEKATASLAKTRGKSWGLPESTRSATPITRPIRIRCQGDRLEIVAERGLRGGKVIALGPRTEDSVDEFVAAVWEYMTGWGIAGNGMYWRPILNVEVAPDGVDRFADLQTLLMDSGLQVRQREP